MKKHTINCETGEAIIEDFTAEEVTQVEADKVIAETEKNAKAEAEAKAQTTKEANDALKASAKAKLIAGEELTEDEANTIVL
jgi:hypothetical protein